MHFAAQSCLLSKQRPACFEVESERWFQTEGAGAAHHRVSSIKQRHRSQHDPPVGKSFDVNDDRKIVSAIEFEFQTGAERLFDQGNRLRLGRIKMFHQQFRVLD